MEGNDELFSLIKSLNKAEKRHFKLHAQMQGGEKEYIFLFDAMDKLSEYDEEKIIKACSGYHFVKHLYKAKSYLFNAIVDVLKDFTAYNTLEYRLLKLMLEIEFLQNKGLALACKKYIAKAKDLAQKLEDFHSLIKLNHFEYLLVKIKESGTTFEMLNKEYENIHTNYSNLLLFEKLYRQSFQLFRKQYKSSSSKIDDFYKEELLQDVSKALSHRAKGLWLHMWALYYNLKTDYLHQYQTQYEILKNFEEQYKDAIWELPDRYAIRIHNFLVASINHGGFNHYEEYLSIYKTLLENKIDASNKIRIEEYNYFDSLIYYYKTAKLAEASCLAKEIEEKKFLANKNMRNVMKESILCLLFTLFFVLAEYKTAMKFLNLLLTNNQKEVKHLNSLCRIYKIMLHYELRNIQLIISEIESTRSFFKRNQLAGELESALLNTFAKLIYAEDKKDEIKIYTGLKNQILQIIQNPSEKVKLEYFNFLLWAEAKITNSPLAGIMQKNPEIEC
jgi:hypothetical protein